METYDLIIVGGGPGGLAAAIYAARRKLKLAIITKDIGGQMLLTPKIENYPGFVEISGADLADKMKTQVELLDVPIFYEEATRIGKEGDLFFVETVYGSKYYAKTLIIAIGREERKLNVPGERELVGKGVSYCSTCDGPFFKDKIVAVVGGGDSAFRSAEYLADIAKKVYLIHRRDQFRAEEILVDAVKQKKNVEFVLNSIVKEIVGKDKVEKLILENVKTREISELKVDGIFIEIGSEVRSELLNGLVKLNEKGEIIVDRLCKTSQPGIFAVGDCTDFPEKQIVIAAGMGAVAALEAYKYIKGLKVFYDWGH